MWAGTQNGSDGANGSGRIAQSYIAGIGASGALLAGAAVSFVFLVGAVSFEVWPATSDSSSGSESLPVAELAGPAATGSPASLGAAVTALAAAIPVDERALKADGGVRGRGDSDQGSGGSGEATPIETGDPGGSGTVAAEPSDVPSGGGGSDRRRGGNSGQGDRGNSGSSTGSTGSNTTQGGSQSGGSGGSDHTQRGSSRGR